MRVQMHEFFAWPAQHVATQWKHQFGWGIGLVALAIAILLFPAILVAIVASVILTVGATLIAAAWQRRPRRSPVHRVRVERVPVSPHDSGWVPRPW